MVKCFREWRLYHFLYKRNKTIKFFTFLKKKKKELYTLNSSEQKEYDLYQDDMIVCYGHKWNIIVIIKLLPRLLKYLGWNACRNFAFMKQMHYKKTTWTKENNCAQGNKLNGSNDINKNDMLLYCHFTSFFYTEKKKKNT